ncbi:MAG: hypothetical protein EBY76_09135 [Betaproteobacteria bacterium]|nr:hypothetical protein [Betaproteobacteria bacterium]
MRLGVYNDSNGAPGSLLIDAGQVSWTSATGAATLSITISQTMNAGWYWTASSISTAAGASIIGYAGNGENFWHPRAVTDPSNNTISNGLYSTTSRNAGGFPDPADAIGGAINTEPLAGIYLRKQ